MGIPCGKQQQKKKYRLDTSSPTSPAEMNEPLSFKVEIGSIKARNLPPNSSYLRIYFGEQREFKTSNMTTSSSNYSWHFHEEFNYNTTKKGLKEDSITIILMSNMPEKELGTVTISLMDIATGPIHQFFGIKMKKGKTDGRLSFDVKMSQIINLTVRTQNITCKLNGSLRDKFYNFSLKMSIRDREFFSEHSLNFKNAQNVHSMILEKFPEDIADGDYQNHMDENKKMKMKYFGVNKMIRKFPKMKHKVLTDAEQDTSENSKDDDSLLHNIAEKKPVPRKSVSQRPGPHGPSLTWINKKDIVWTYSQDDDLAPVLEMSVNVGELANGSFQFFLWASKEGGLNKSSENEASDLLSEDVYIDHKLVCTCCIGANRMFYNDDSTGPEEGSIRINLETGTFDQPSASRSIQRKNIRLTEKLQYHGEHEGELISEFVIEHPSFFKQMIFGVRTEKGIERSSSLYHIKADDPSTNTNVNQIKILSQHKEALKMVAFNLFSTKVAPRAKIKFAEDLSSNILKVLEILKTSNQESLVSMLYKTPENLLVSQKVLIGLTKHALETCDIVRPSLRQIYYETLLLLIHRPEFELNYMGFDESYSDFLKNAQKISFKSDCGGQKIDLKNMQQKFHVCESYQSLLYLGLQKVLPKLSQRGLPDKEKEFVEQFTAIAYFKIPEFRKKLLECLKKDIENVPIMELRGTEWDLDAHSDANRKNQHFISLFDWEGDFYVYLSDSEKGQANREILREILEDKDWQNRISKKGLPFCSFLNEWVKYVNKTVVTKEHVPWQDLPGYAILIKCFMIELKSKDVKRYPQPILDASYSLLKNEKLLNVFIPVIYNKTRVYESFNVFAVFDLINNWFTILRESKRTISLTFDYSYFFKGSITIYPKYFISLGVGRILEGEHALNIAKVLWVLYNNFNFFPVSEKEHLCEFVFGPIFFKLFLHWSWSVRQVFHHLLLYRFYHQHRTANTNLTNLEDLKKELLLYNQRRENYKQTKKLLVNDFINMEYSRHMTIIENAYKKLLGEKSQKDFNIKPINTESRVPKDIIEEEGSRIKKRASEGEEFSPGRKGEYFPKLKLTVASSEKQGVDNVVDDFFEKNNIPNRRKKPSLTQYGGESSYFIINPDSLESSVHGAMVRPSRSESFSFNPAGMIDMNRNEDLNLLDMEMEKAAAVSEARTENQIFQNTRNSMDIMHEDEKKSKEKRKVRRLIYFDKQTNKLQEIPKEYAVYLAIAYKEYELIKLQYLKWCNETQQTYNKLSEESVKKMKVDPKVPELKINIPLDDGEDGQIDPEEW